MLSSICTPFNTQENERKPHPLAPAPRRWPANSDVLERTFQHSQVNRPKMCTELLLDPTPSTVQHWSVGFAGNHVGTHDENQCTDHADDRDRIRGEKLRKQKHCQFSEPQRN